MDPDSIDWSPYGWRLVCTLLLVLANGFFVAAEFALVKLRVSQVEGLAESRGPAGQRVRLLRSNLERYLSACQLGITIASLLLGWIAEPALAELLLTLAQSWGWATVPGPLLHGAAIALALSVVTLLHMTLGEQAPKLWGIYRAERTALIIGGPLRVFELVFRPFIWAITGITRAMLRMAGLSQHEIEDSQSPGAEELGQILSASAAAGHISERERELAENVLGIMELEVRHILVPRVDVVYLSLQRSLEENLEVMQGSGHSRFPLCEVGLDTVIGIVHAKQVLAELGEGRKPDLSKHARRPLFASDTQPLSQFIVQLQRTRNHCAVVVDEHGTAIGLGFLEDAIEEIVGPIQDEFDESEPWLVRLPSGGFDLPGSMALPEATEVLELSGDDLSEDEDTIGGVVVARLGRLPQRGDQLRIGGYRATVQAVVRHRIDRLRFEPHGGADEGESGQ